MAQTSPQTAAAPSRAEERRAFLLLAVVLAPVLAIALVGGYGFLIWMSQILMGPPAG